MVNLGVTNLQFKVQLSITVVLLTSLLIITSAVFAQNDINELIEKLGQNDFRASMTLQRMGRDAIPALTEALLDPDYPNHLNVIYVLDRMKLEEAIPTLKLGLGFGPKVREAAVKALVKFDNLSIGELAAELLVEDIDYHFGVASLISASSHNRVEIVAQLLNNLDFAPDRPEVVQRVAYVIAMVYVEQDDLTRAAILDLLSEQAHRSVAYRSYLRMAQLARGLGIFAEAAPYSVADQLVECLKNSNESINNQIMAAQALSIIAPTDPQAIQLFVELLVNAEVESDLTKAAVAGLEKAGGLAKNYVSQLVKAVEKLPEDAQWRLARVFVESGKIEPSVVEFFISRLASSNSQETDFYYVRILGAIGSEAASAKQQLEGKLVKAENDELKAAIQRALEQIGR